MVQPLPPLVVLNTPNQLVPIRGNGIHDQRVGRGESEFVRKIRFEAGSPFGQMHPDQPPSVDFRIPLRLRGRLLSHRWCPLSSVEDDRMAAIIPALRELFTPPTHPAVTRYEHAVAAGKLVLDASEKDVAGVERIDSDAADAGGSLVVSAGASSCQVSPPSSER